MNHHCTIILCVRTIISIETTVRNSGERRTIISTVLLTLFLTCSTAILDGFTGGTVFKTDTVHTIFGQKTIGAGILFFLLLLLLYFKVTFLFAVVAYYSMTKSTIILAVGAKVLLAQRTMHQVIAFFAIGHFALITKVDITAFLAEGFLASITKACKLAIVTVRLITNTAGRHNSASFTIWRVTV